MVAVDDRRRIGIAGVLGIALGQTFQVFVVVVGVGAPIEADVATHNGVRERIAVALDLPVAEDEALVRLRGVNGVEHKSAKTPLSEQGNVKEEGSVLWYATDD